MYNRVKRVYSELITIDDEFKRDIQSGKSIRLIVSHLNGKRCAYYKNRHRIVDLFPIFGDCSFYNILVGIWVYNFFEYKNFNPDYLRYYEPIEIDGMIEINYSYCDSYLYPKMDLLFSRNDGEVINDVSGLKEILSSKSDCYSSIMRIYRHLGTWYFTRYGDKFLESNEIEDSDLLEVVNWMTPMYGGVIRDLFWFPRSLDDSVCRVYSDKGIIVIS